MSLETITVFKDEYYRMMNREFEKSSDLAFLQGTIRALSTMDDSPDFVFRQLKEIVEKFEKEVDTQTA